MASPVPRSPSPGSRLRDLPPRLLHIFHKEIWQSATLKDRSLKGICFAILRVLSITGTVCKETRIVSRAAALSFSSLLGLGPLIAIGVLIAGFAIGQTKSDQLAKTLTELIQTVAPQLEQYDTEATGPNPALVGIIDNIIAKSQSGAMGTTGVFTLIIVVLLMFKGVEDAFNDIWGVRQGRSLIMRIVLYWTALTLGAVLFFTAVALTGASTIVVFFNDKFPWLNSVSWSLPAFSFLLLALMLTLFYRVIPNTRVAWKAAFLGAVVVTALLVGNNFIAFVYVKRVFLEKSLYGGLALPLVLLSVLYVFWLCVLIGGTVSYAVQNVHFRNSQAAWSTLTESMRERLALVVFLTICRRFRECLPPISASHLSDMLKVPTQLLNECLNRLVLLKLVTTLRPDPNLTTTDYLYQPGRPLNKITLFDFKTLDDNFGENPIGTSLEHIEPLIGHYDTALSHLGQQDFFQKNLEQLFAEYPFDESRPPFAMGDRRAGKTAGDR